MIRAPLSLLIVAACTAVTLPAIAAAQPDVKSRPNAQPPPTLTHPLSRATADRERVVTRVAVGEQAPDFDLEQMDGKPLRLSKLKGDWLMVFFVERRESLDVIEPAARTLREIGVKTLAVCFDKSSALARRFAGRDLAFTPLADPTGDIVALYGLMDGNDPQPGFVLVSPKGDVRLALLGHGLPSGQASRMAEVAVRGE